MARKNYGEICFDLTSLGDIKDIDIRLPNDVWESIKKLSGFAEGMFSKLDKDIYIIACNINDFIIKFRLNCINDDRTAITGSYADDNYIYRVTISADGVNGVIAIHQTGLVIEE